MVSSEAGERALDAADEARARNDLDAVVANLSTAIRGFTEAGMPCRAAMTCVQLGDLLANAMGHLAAGRAWYARARRLVEDEPECVEQGWVAVAAMGCDVDDPDVLLESAELALGRARTFREVGLETKALADAGLAHVQAGRVRQGMDMLEEAMALACGPTDDGDVIAKSVCSFFTACYHAADFERASTWAELFRRRGLLGTDTIGQVFLSSHCDSVQATLLIELGRWSDAERLLVAAKERFERLVPMSSWHPDIALADLRIRQGRLAEAESLLAGKEHSMEALLPAVRLHVERGDVELARAAVRRGRRAMAGDRLRVAWLLVAEVDAELAAGDLARARAVSRELAERVDGLEVRSLLARSRQAAASVHAAAGEPAVAIEQLEGGLDALTSTGFDGLRLSLLVDLVEQRCRLGDVASARADAGQALHLLALLDVVLPAETVQRLQLIVDPAARTATTGSVATLHIGTSGTSVTSGGTVLRLRRTKGLRHLAELIAHPGVDRHALDLVDRVEGVHEDRSVDRRALGDAGPLADASARRAYRRRVEQLRLDADEAIAQGRLERAIELQDELDRLVSHLAASFGLGGRDRVAGDAAERARLNVTRAVRTAIATIAAVLPDEAAVLDRRVQTGRYCRFDPAEDDPVRWTVDTGSFSPT